MPHFDKKNNWSAEQTMNINVKDTDLLTLGNKQININMRPKIQDYEWAKRALSVNVEGGARPAEEMGMSPNSETILFFRDSLCEVMQINSYQTAIVLEYLNCP